MIDEERLTKLAELDLNDADASRLLSRRRQRRCPYAVDQYHANQWHCGRHHNDESAPHAADGTPCPWCSGAAYYWKTTEENEDND